MDIPKALRNAPSHFNWNLYERSLKEFDVIRDQLFETIEYSPAMAVEALLLMSYIHVSKRNRKDNATAEDYLEKSYAKIKETAEENGPAWIGYMTIAIANEAIMVAATKTVSGRSREVRELETKVQKLISLKTQQSQAYEDSTRAFALSRMGVPKYQEALKYYQQALDLEPENPNWLFGKALIVGRLARNENGLWSYSDKMKEERQLLEEVIRLKPSYVTAMFFLAQNRCIEGNVEVGLEICNKALEKERSCTTRTYQGINPSHIRIICKIFRRKGSYQHALNMLQKCERDGCVTSHLYHQWGLVYRDIYKEQKLERDRALGRKRQDPREQSGEEARGREQRREEARGRGQRGGEVRGRGRGIGRGRGGLYETSSINLPPLEKSLLYKAISYFDKALECNKTNTTALLDRAHTYERLRDMEMADADFKDLVSMQDISGGDKVAAHYSYGLFLYRTMRKEHEAIEQFRSAIECAFQHCQIQSDEKTLQPKKFGYRVDRDVNDAAEKFQKLSQDHLLETKDQKYEALHNLAWLKFAFGEYTAAKTTYEECLKDFPTDVEAMKGLALCLINLEDYQTAESMINTLQQVCAATADKCKLELRLLQGRKALREQKFQDAKYYLLETLDLESIEGCEDLLLTLESCSEEDKTTWEFRAACAKILYYYNRKHAKAIKDISDDISRLRLDEDTQSRGLESFTADIKSLMDLEDIVRGKLRLTHCRMEQTILECKSEENKTTLDAAAEVIGEAHALLGRVMISFKEKHYTETKPSRCPYFYIRGGKEAKTEDDVREELLKRIDSKDKGNYQWKGFKEKFPELLNFLVKVKLF